MISLTILIRLDFPLEAAMVIEMIFELCGFDFYQTDTLYEEVFNFRETDQVYGSRLDSNGEETSKFEDAELDSPIFIELLGPIFLVTSIAVLASILLVTCKCITRRCKDKLLIRFFHKDHGLANKWQRFFMEGCLELGLCAVISVSLVSILILRTIV